MAKCHRSAHQSAIPARSPVLVARSDIWTSMGMGFVAASEAPAIVNVIDANQGGEGETVSANEDVDLFTLLAVDVASQQKCR
jgi:hypothetical protein